MRSGWKPNLRKQNWIRSENQVAIYLIVTATSLVPSLLPKSKQYHHREGQPENFPCCSAVAEKSGAGMTAVQQCILFRGRAPVFFHLRRDVHRVYSSSHLLVFISGLRDIVEFIFCSRVVSHLANSTTLSLSYYRNINSRFSFLFNFNCTHNSLR